MKFEKTKKKKNLGAWNMTGRIIRKVLLVGASITIVTLTKGKLNLKK